MSKHFSIVLILPAPPQKFSEQKSLPSLLTRQPRLTFALSSDDTKSMLDRHTLPTQYLTTLSQAISRSPALTEVRIPLYASPVSAGFPSPAEDVVEMGIDLNKLLIAHPAATFLVRAAGTSMIEAGIFSDDLLVVDRSIQAVPGAIVVAYYADEFLVKRLVKKSDGLYLVAENKNFSFRPVKVTEEIIIWGVVRSVVRVLHQKTG